MYTRRIEHSRGNKIYNILTVYHHCALSGILPPLRSSEWHYCHLERKWEISYKAHYLARDSSGLFIPRRMTLHHKVLQLLSFRTETYGRVWEISGYPRKILRCFAPQNDMCRKGVNTLQGILHFAYAAFRMTMIRNFFPAAKKSPRKVARLVIGYSCLSLHSPSGAAELALLKQSSPYFRLLPRSRQPDKGGHFFDSFSEITGCVEW